MSSGHSTELMALTIPCCQLVGISNGANPLGLLNSIGDLVSFNLANVFTSSVISILIDDIECIRVIAEIKPSRNN